MVVWTFVATVHLGRSELDQAIEHMLSVKDGSSGSLNPLVQNSMVWVLAELFIRMLENIVFLELIRRGYDVTIGKIGTLEVDFVATKSNEKFYYQVSASIADTTTRERELRPLQAISDNYPKVVLTMDQTPFDDYEGIKIQNIIEFLLA